MTQEEIKKLAEKIASGEVTKEERLLFLDELNKLLKEVKSDLTSAKSE